MTNPYDVVRQFESALCDYTGAKYAVTTTSCTTALLLILSWYKSQVVSIPRRTYVGVAQSVLNARHELDFRDDTWSGSYQLKPLPIWDSARRFTSDMYIPGQFQACSFHWSKHLAIGQGGVILHDDSYADQWLRRARFDGRGGDDIITPAYHAYMMPRDAAEGLSRLAVLPKNNEDLPNSDYPDLKELFQ